MAARSDRSGSTPRGRILAALKPNGGGMDRLGFVANLALCNLVWLKFCGRFCCGRNVRLWPKAACRIAGFDVV